MLIVKMVESYFINLVGCGVLIILKEVGRFLSNYICLLYFFIFIFFLFVVLFYVVEVIVILRIFLYWVFY